MEIKTQNDMIIRSLRQGNKITAVEALSQFGSFRLSARIWDLRHMGNDIKARRKYIGNGRTVSEYYLGKN